MIVEATPTGYERPDPVTSEVSGKPMVFVPRQMASLRALVEAPGGP